MIEKESEVMLGAQNEQNRYLQKDNAMGTKEVLTNFWCTKYFPLQNDVY